MGVIIHDAVIVTTLGHEHMPDVDGFRDSMPQELRPLVVGPIPAARNSYVTYVFAPDGSKEGWDVSDECEEWRERFIELFSYRHGDGSTPFDIVAVQFGEDLVHDGGARITYEQPKASEIHH